MMGRQGRRNETLTRHLNTHLNSALGTLARELHTYIHNIHARHLNSALGALFLPQTQVLFNAVMAKTM